jgi:hypothetical protein
LLSASVFAADDETRARAAFEESYQVGTAAALEKNWPKARDSFAAAIKALGEYSHPKKGAAQVLLTKATEAAKKEPDLSTADELLRLKQWKEAEAAYRKAAEVAGETEAIKNGIAAAQAGAKAESTSLPPPPKPAPKIETKEPAPAPKAEAPALDPPQPIALDRDEWTKGPGSACYWAGERLYLEEGDEQFKKVLKGDFAVSVLFEAQMDHRSAISIELRSPRDADEKTRIVGWGSKDGSAPMLMVDREIKAKGDARPPREQFVLSLVRNGRKIEFFCNGKSIGVYNDTKPNHPYQLWACGKGIMDGAKVVQK